MTGFPRQTELEPPSAAVGLKNRPLSAGIQVLYRVGEWIEAHPKRAQWVAILFLLIVVGVETNYWPSHNFPGALWHNSPRGDDIELAQANAAKAGWPELWSYWTGPMIHGHGYYRPLTSWLFVYEYRLFGMADGKWAFVNIALHLAVCALLFWAGGVLAGGSATRRLTIGALAVLLLGAPGLADRNIQSWICGWWPCQSEMLSLVAGLTLLAAIVRFVETGRGRWLALGVAAMVIGILFKEMTYVAGLGACLLLVRHRTRWWGGVSIVVPAIALFLIRKWAIRDVALQGGIPMGGVVEHLKFQGVQLVDQVSAAWMFYGAFAGAVVVAVLLLRRSGWGERAAVALVLYFAVTTLLLGMPWDTSISVGHKTLLQTVSVPATLFSLARAARRWPVPELCVIWTLTQLPALGFMPIFAWYRYWGDVFGSLLIAIAVWEVLEWGAGRLSLSPTRSTPQTPASRPPEVDGSLATGPTAA